MRIIDAGAGAYNALAFGEKSQASLNFLHNQMMMLPQLVNATGAAFVKQGIELYEKFNGAEALRAVKAAVRTVQHLLDADVVRVLNSISDFQQAKHQMQRWVMACPEVREFYHRGGCDGYSDTYINLHPGLVGIDHNDWRIVNTGIIGEEDDSGEYSYTIYGTDNEDDTVLTIIEKDDILQSWENIKSKMKIGNEDPTSPYCGKL